MASVPIDGVGYRALPSSTSSEPQRLPWNLILSQIKGLDDLGSRLSPSFQDGETEARGWGGTRCLEPIAEKGAPLTLGSRPAPDLPMPGCLPCCGLVRTEVPQWPLLVGLWAWRQVVRELLGTHPCALGEAYGLRWESCTGSREGRAAL